MPMTASPSGRRRRRCPARAACARSATSSPACRVATAMSVSAAPDARRRRAGRAGRRTRRAAAPGGAARAAPGCRSCGSGPRPAACRHARGQRRRASRGSSCGVVGEQPQRLGRAGEQRGDVLAGARAAGPAARRPGPRRAAAAGTTVCRRAPRTPAGRRAGRRRGSGQAAKVCSSTGSRYCWIDAAPGHPAGQRPQVPQRAPPGRRSRARAASRRPPRGASCSCSPGTAGDRRRAAAGRTASRAAAAPRGRAAPARPAARRRRRRGRRAVAQRRGRASAAAASSVGQQVGAPQPLQLQPVLDGAQEAVGGDQRRRRRRGRRSRRRDSAAQRRQRAAEPQRRRRPGRAPAAAAARRTRRRAGRRGPSLSSRSALRRRDVVLDPAAHGLHVGDEVRAGRRPSRPAARAPRRSARPRSGSPATGRVLSSAWNSQVLAHRW